MISDEEVQSIATYNSLVRRLDRAVKRGDEIEAQEIRKELIEDYPEIFGELQQLADFFNSVNTEVTVKND